MKDNEKTASLIIAISTPIHSPRLRPGAIAIVGLVLGLVAAACGSSGATGTPSAASSAAPSATIQAPSAPATGAPSTTPSPLEAPSADLTALASQYSDISTRAAAAVTQCTTDADAAASGLGSGKMTLAAAKLAAAECLAAYSQDASDFEKANWGPVQRQADNVITVLKGLDLLMTTMANAPDAQTFRTAYDQFPIAAQDLRTAGAAMRAALGLPAAS